MLDKILKLFLGDTSKRTLSEINPIIDSVKAAEHELQNISDQALRAETEGFRQRLRAASEVQIAERDLLKIQADSEVDVDAKDALYRQIDAIDQEVLAQEERILIELLPRAFAVLRETARRLNNGPLRLPATDWDREMAAKIDAVELEGRYRRLEESMAGRGQRYCMEYGALRRAALWWRGAAQGAHRRNGYG